MLIADLNEIEGRTYPARRRPKNLGGGASPIQIGEFCMGFVVLEPNGGQVPKTERWFQFRLDGLIP